MTAYQTGRVFGSSLERGVILSLASSLPHSNLIQRAVPCGIVLNTNVAVGQRVGCHHYCKVCVVTAQVAQCYSGVLAPTTHDMLEKVVDVLCR